MMRASSGESVTCALSALLPLSRGRRPIASSTCRARALGSAPAFARMSGRDAALLVEQRREHMLGRRLRVVLVQSARIGSVKRVADALGHLLYVHFPNTIQRVASIRLQEQTFRQGARSADP